MDRIRSLIQQQNPIAKKHVSYEDDMHQRWGNSFAPHQKQSQTVQKFAVISPKPQVQTMAPKPNSNAPIPIVTDKKPQSKSQSQQPTTSKTKVKVSVGINTGVAPIAIPPKRSSKTKEDKDTNKSQKTKRPSSYSPSPARRPVANQNQPINQPSSSKRQDAKIENKTVGQRSKSQSSTRAVTKTNQTNIVIEEVKSSASIDNEKRKKVSRSRSLSVAEAAAKLSLPWPPIQPQSKDKAITQENIDDVIASKTQGMNPKLVREMKNFFNEHKDADIWDQKSNPNGPKKMSRMGTNLNIQMQLDKSLEAIMDSVKIAFMQSNLNNFGQVQNFKPCVPPKWDEVETNWPGFERRPLENWMDYATPSKINQSSRQQLKNSSGKNHADAGGSGSNKRARRERLVHHQGMCQV